jgi:hypothetical protein
MYAQKQQTNVLAQGSQMQSINKPIFSYLSADLIFSIRTLFPFFHDFDLVSKDFLTVSRAYQKQSVLTGVSHLTTYQLSRLILICAAHASAWWDDNISKRSINDIIDVTCTFYNGIENEVPITPVELNYVRWHYTKFARGTIPYILLLDKYMASFRETMGDGFVKQMLNDIESSSIADWHQTRNKGPMYNFQTESALTTKYAYKYWLTPTTKDPDSQLVAQAYYKSNMASMALLLRAHKQYVSKPKERNLKLLKKDELVQMLRLKGMKVSGNKDQLIARLLNK